MDNISACSIPSLPVSADDTLVEERPSLVEDDSLPLHQPSLSASRESFEQDSHDEIEDANWISRIKQEILQTFIPNVI